jgi:8-amino-7-oxononanoate synthase
MSLEYTTGTPNTGRLSGDAKSNLLGQLRGSKAPVRANRLTTARKTKVVRSRPVLKFDELDTHRQIKLQSTAAEMLGIDNPFFRAHDGIAGATTMIEGKEYINFASYNYADLNGHPAITDAVKAAVDRYGISASASRLVAGERPIHREFETEIAKFYGVEDSVVFVSGHATNVATIGHLMGPDDLILHDSFIHNSIVVGTQLSGAQRLAFPHNDLDSLEQMLVERRDSHEKVLVVVEGLYSMDGDFPDLRRLLALRQRFGFWLMVDEAHALGVVGKTGRGLAEHFDVDPNDVDIWMGTLSKTLSGCGGYIAGSSALVDILKATAPGFVYSVGIPPAIAAAGLASLKILQEEPERVSKLQENGRFFVEQAKKANLDIADCMGYAVVPVIVGDSIRATVLSNRLLARGINALPIIHPAVPEKMARLRFFLTSAHTHEQISSTVEIVAEEIQKLEEANFSLATAAASLG